VLRSGFKEKRISPQAKNAYFSDVSCSLKAVAERRLDIDISKEQQKSDWGAEELELEQIEYAACRRRYSSSDRCAAARRA
jgi:hypothetical protein